MIRPLKPGYLLFFLMSDVLLVWTALALSAYLRKTLGFGISGPNEAFATPWTLYLLASAIWLAGFWQANVYSPHHHLRHHLRRIITGHSIASLLFLGALYVSFRDYSRLQSFYFIALTFVGVVVHRVIAHFVLRAN